MLSDNQKLIIKEVCSIQFKSLEGLVQSISLGKEFEELMDTFDISRGEYDGELIKTYKKFQIVEKNPEAFLQVFDRYDMMIFKYILFGWSYKWKHMKPDFLNLWDKLYIISTLSMN